MITLYCDEDVDVLIKPLLEAKGFRVITTREAKKLGASDIRQMDYAIRKGYVFLTHNRMDYERLYTGLVDGGKNHTGIIIATRRNVYELARRVSKVLSGYTGKSISNLLLYV